MCGKCINSNDATGTSTINISSTNTTTNNITTTNTTTTTTTITTNITASSTSYNNTIIWECLLTCAEPCRCS